MGWQSDWLYARVFAEIKANWEAVQKQASERADLFGPPPERLRLQQCGGIK